MTIIKITTSSYENWFRATEHLPNGATAIGFGSTITNALNDCFRDIEKVISLTANQSNSQRVR